MRQTFVDKLKCPASARLEKNISQKLSRAMDGESVKPGGRVFVRYFFQDVRVENCNG